MVEKDRRKQEDEKELVKLRSMLRIERVREEAEFGISLGLQSATKGPVHVQVEERTNSQFSAMFFHNPNLERSQMGGLAMLWVLIPKVEEPEIHWGERPVTKKPGRLGVGEPDPSRN
ncbi:MAG: hypothetical protein KGH94_02020 [Candidatus Micrarchaeota archaeon]|nr:hypothetical protein [Candidatus Micrarchaeota archaeon]